MATSPSRSITLKLFRVLSNRCQGPPRRNRRAPCFPVKQRDAGGLQMTGQIFGAFWHILCAPPNNPLPAEQRGQLVERLPRNRELLGDTLE